MARRALLYSRENANHHNIVLFSNYGINLDSINLHEQVATSDRTGDFLLCRILGCNISAHVSRPAERC